MKTTCLIQQFIANYFKVLIGSGGREHAICVSLKKSSKVEKIYCFPGNAGTSEIAENADLFMKRVEENGPWTLMCPNECPNLFNV